MVANGEGGTTAGWDREMIAGCGLHGDETLQAARWSEALHCSAHHRIYRMLRKGRMIGFV